MNSIESSFATLLSVRARVCMCVCWHMYGASKQKRVWDMELFTVKLFYLEWAVRCVTVGLIIILFCCCCCYIFTFITFALLLLLLFLFFAFGNSYCDCTCLASVWCFVFFSSILYVPFFLMRNEKKNTYNFYMYICVLSCTDISVSSSHFASSSTSAQQ